MNASTASPFAVLGPQFALVAGILCALMAGMSGRVTPIFYRFLAICVLLSAAAFACMTLPGSYGPLVRVDGLSLSWQFLFYVGAIPYALSLTEDEVPSALVLGSVLGASLLACSGSLLMLFIGLELMSLPAYLLVARGEAENSAEAAVKYFFAGGTAGALYLMGMSLYYAGTGSLSLAPSAGGMAEAGVALMGTAALFKVGAVPLHFWLPDAYEAAAPELAGFMSTSIKAAGFLLLMRLVALTPLSAFARSLPSLGALTALVGAVTALRQERLQRLLAYSSISHAGLLILGVGAWAAQGALPGGAGAIFFYLAAYVFMSNGSFAFLRVSGITTRTQLRGYGATQPVKAALFSALLLALAGIPPTAGFLAKFLIFWEAVKAGLYVPAAGCGLAALVGLGYYLGLVSDMFFVEAGASEAAPPVIAKAGASVVWACAVPAAVLGLAPWLIGGLAGWLGQ
jgi:NADH-quinone oxidoreductase subunit N